jgi:hypothetical protein
VKYRKLRWTGYVMGMLFNDVCVWRRMVAWVSESRYDRRSVGQSVLVSSPIWGSWPHINYCLTVTVCSMSGAPSDERSTLSFVLVIVRQLSVNVYRFSCNIYVTVAYIYTRPLSVQVENSSFLSSLGYNGSLVIWSSMSDELETGLRKRSWPNRCAIPEFS